MEEIHKERHPDQEAVSDADVIQARRKESDSVLQKKKRQKVPTSTPERDEHSSENRHERIQEEDHQLEEGGVTTRTEEVHRIHYQRRTNRRHKTDPTIQGIRRK